MGARREGLLEQAVAVEPRSKERCSYQASTGNHTHRMVIHYHVESKAEGQAAYRAGTAHQARLQRAGVRSIG